MRPLICDGCHREIANRVYVVFSPVGQKDTPERDICKPCYKRIEEMFGW